MDKAFLRLSRPQFPYLPVPTKAALLARRHEKSDPIEEEPIEIQRTSSLAVRDVSNVVEIPEPSYVVSTGSTNNISETSYITKGASSGIEELGLLTQGPENWIIYTKKRSWSTKNMIMFKKVDKGKGRLEVALLNRLSHPNIVQFKQAFETEDSLYIGLSYTRCTLKQLLHVHVPLGEPQIQLLAASVSIVMTV